MFANTNLGVLSLAFPDVCNVPVSGVPVPTPFPNISISLMDIPVQFEVIIGGGLGENLITISSMTQGDEAGVEGGLESVMFMGPARTLLGSFTVYVGGVPCTHLFDLTGQNGMLPNAEGTSLTPAQITVLVFS
ncbi:DUF4150 domain-containing protein [Oleiagrimonas soli]|uniref:Uncharacterized protein n=1 Tax=Oleiagrimonas soli TaxID=1543381 RepID=A0A099CWB4_9GAMM|nr:DUF4150 domain-containing protein [Oleiagrimonas soli]KGI78273.1 hypothetical protein LF63_0108105 [Oleiagrimonas soli]MBB6183246.1 hypothetical protein [Oleiagrimonas soli]